jgi:transcriptional regulator with XRE-family HTH domain
MRSQDARKKLSATDVRILQTLLLVNVFEPGAIGDRIAQARNEAGLRQEDLADLIDVSTRSIQGYEAGTTNAYRKIREIARVTGKPVEWLLHGDSDEESPSSDEISQVVEEVGELRAFLYSFASALGVDPEQIRRDASKLPVEEREREDEDREPPVEESQVG